MLSMCKRNQYALQQSLLLEFILGLQQWLIEWCPYLVSVCLWHVSLYINYISIIYSMVYTSNRNMHGRNIRQECDLHVASGGTDRKRNSTRVPWANTRNSILENIKISVSMHVFKQRLPNHLFAFRKKKHPLARGVVTAAEKSPFPHPDFNVSKGNCALYIFDFAEMWLYCR